MPHPMCTWEAKYCTEGYHCLDGWWPWRLAKDGSARCHRNSHLLVANASPTPHYHSSGHTGHFKLSPPHWTSCKSSLYTHTHTHTTVYKNPTESLLSTTQSFLLEFLPSRRACGGTKPKALLLRFVISPRNLHHALTAQVRPPAVK